MNPVLKLHGEFDRAILNRDWKVALRIAGKLQGLINPENPVDIEKSRMIVRVYAGEIHGLKAAV